MLVVVSLLVCGEMLNKKGFTLLFYHLRVE